MPIANEVREAVVNVSLGEIRVAQDRSETLVAFGLGSCVAVCLWEPTTQLAAMAHVVLPASAGQQSRQPGKYADTAVPALVEAMNGAGGRPDRLICRVVGGASVLALPGSSPMAQIGERNVGAVLEALQRARIRVAGRDVGGTRGRTVRMHAADGRVWVRELGKPERLI